MILAMLTEIPKTGRFALNVQFMEEKDKQCVREVFNWLEDIGCGNEGRDNDATTASDGSKQEESNSLISNLRSQFKL